MTATELFDKTPELRQLKKRLEQSDTDAREKNAQAQGSGPKTEVSPLYFKIQAVEHHDVLRPTAYDKQCGGDQFVRQIEDALESYPGLTVLKIAIYKSKGSGSALDEYHIPVGEKKKTDNAGPSPLNGAVPQSPTGDFQLAIMRIEHKNEITDLKHNYERQVDKLIRIKEELENEIEELKKQLFDKGNELGRVKSQKDDSGEKIIAIGKGLLAGGFETLLKKNPKILKALNMSDEVIASLWTESNSGTSNQDDDRPNATAESKDEFSHLSEAHRELIKELFGVLKAFSEEEFKAAYALISCHQKEDGDIDMALTKKTVDEIKAAKAAAKKNETTTA